MILLNLRFDVRLNLGLIVAFSAFVGAAGCNTQSLVATDGGARTGSGGSTTTGSGNRSGGTAAETGTDSGAGGVIGTSGAGGAIGTRGVGGIVGTTGAAGFGRPFGGAAGFRFPIGGMAGRRPGVGGDDGGQTPVDASTATPPEDAGACQCLVGADSVLRMSWDCFTTYFGGGALKSGWCNGGPGGWVSSCGLDVFKLNRDDSTIPDDEWVYDASGNLVGQQIAEVSPVFVCPTAPMTWPAVSIVAAGQFPGTGCAVTNCTCGDAGALNCPGPDASVPNLPIF